MKIVIEFARNVFYSSEKSGNLATKAQRNYKKYDRRQFTLDPRHFTLDSRQYTLDPRLMFRKLRRAWRASPYSWIQSATLNKNHLSIHNQQRRECPSFWLDGHLPPSGNHTILLLERIPHFNFPQFSKYLFQIFSARRNAFSDFSGRFPLYFLVVGGNLVLLWSLQTRFRLHSIGVLKARVKVVEKMSRFSTDGKSK